MYHDLKTMGNRNFEYAIVDEVDNMLIDDNSKIARLSTSIAGIETLQYMYHLIWN